MSAKLKGLSTILSQCVRCNRPTSLQTLSFLLPPSNPAPISSLTSSSLGLGTHNFTQVRYKFDKRSRKNTSHEEDDDEDVLQDFKDLEGGKDNKVAKVKVTSLRTDLLIKSGLGMARNKVEAAFYDSRIRINGKKVPKKSSPIKTGDEIDVIKETSPLNPANLVVARLEVLSVQPNTEDITVILRRFKTLTIENYEAENVWKQASSE